MSWTAGFRDEVLEEEVTALVGAVQDGSRPHPDYVERTVITTVSTGMTGRGFLSWTVDAASAESVAAEMVDAVHVLVVPWLRRLADERPALAAAAYRSRKTGPRNLTRAVLLARDTDDAAGAGRLLREAAETAVGDNLAHAAMREAITLVKPVIGM